MQAAAGSNSGCICCCSAALAGVPNLLVHQLAQLGTQAAMGVNSRLESALRCFREENNCFYRVIVLWRELLLLQLRTACLKQFTVLPALFFFPLKYFYFFNTEETRLKGIISNMFSFLFLKSHFSMFFHSPVPGYWVLTSTINTSRQRIKFCLETFRSLKNVELRELKKKWGWGKKERNEKHFQT